MLKHQIFKKIAIIKTYLNNKGINKNVLFHHNKQNLRLIIYSQSKDLKII